MSKPRRQSGFTLLEILLAMAMVAMLALSLYASLHIAFKARDTATAAIAPVRAVQVAMDLIRQDLENALPPTGTLAGPFIGTPAGVSGTASDTLEFYCMGHATTPLSDDPIEAGGIQRVDFLMDAPPEGNGAEAALVREVSKNLLAQQVEDPQAETLCRNVKTLTFRYYDGSSWTDTWDSTQMDNMLPIAVEVFLEITIPSKDASEPRTYRMDRVFTLPCYSEASTTSDGSGETGGATP